MAVQYCTTLQVAQYLNWVKEAPGFVSGSSTSLEEVDTSGTLANGSIITLDQNNVLDNTLILSYGASATSVTVLTETTHYTVDLDKAEITITTAGAAAIGANNVYAEYKYMLVDGRPMMSNSFISDLIDRNTRLADLLTKRTWQTVTQKTTERHLGKGKFDRKYRVKNLPLSVTKTQLSADVVSGATTITVDAVTGLSTSDYLSVNTENMQISGITDSTQITVSRAQLGSSAAAHSDDDWVINMAVQISNTPTSSVPSFNAIQFPEDYDVDDITGIITLLHTDITPEGLFLGFFPEKGVPDRFRAWYTYGSSAVPVDITELTILLTVKSLTTGGVSKNFVEGVEMTTATANTLLDRDIKQIVDRNRLFLADTF